MKIILGADPLVPPLTGIGRYTFELADRLPSADEIDEVRLFSFGRWQDFPQLRAQIQSSGNEAETALPSPSALASLRAKLASSRLAVAAYGTIAPHVFRQILKPYGDEYLFHGPNFYVPPYAGPTAVTIHDLSTFLRPEDHPRARVEFVEREVRKVLDGHAHLITDAEAVRREIIDYFGVPASRVTSVPIGVNSAFAPAQPSALRPILDRYSLANGGYGLCVATLEPRKNIARLIAAYADLKRPLRDRFPLVLIGDRGWKSDAVHEKVRDAEAAGWLRYLGYVPQGHLSALFAGANGFFFPSLYEGFGLPVLEAMACGVPVLTSDCSTMPEVADGCALLVDPMDTDGIRNAIQRLFEDHQWRESAKARGLARARELSWDACVAATIGVYRQVSGQ